METQMNSSHNFEILMIQGIEKKTGESSSYPTACKILALVYIRWLSEKLLLRMGAQFPDLPPPLSWAGGWIEGGCCLGI